MVETAFSMIKQVQSERKEHSAELTQERVDDLKSEREQKAERAKRKETQLAKSKNAVKHPWKTAREVDVGCGFDPNDKNSVSKLKDVKMRQLIVAQMQYLFRVKAVKKKELPQSTTDVEFDETGVSLGKKSQKLPTPMLRSNLKQFLDKHPELYRDEGARSPAAPPVGVKPKSNGKSKSPAVAKAAEPAGAHKQKKQRKRSKAHGDDAYTGH